MVTGWLPVAVSLTVGVVLGVIHFSGLWLTVRRLVMSRWPALVIFGSFGGRMAVSLSGFFLVARSDRAQLPVCLAAFLLTRLAVLRSLRPPAPGSLIGGDVYGTES